LLAVAVIGTFAVSGLSGQDAGMISPEPSILERSPFLPPGFSPPGSASGGSAARAKVDGYEFRGIYQIGEEYRFLVSEPRSRKGNWVKLGKAYDGYEVRNFDPSSETLTLFFNNSEKQLTLAELASNPTPMPVSGQIKAPAKNNPTVTPTRRTIRPATPRTSNTTQSSQSSKTPPPAWLEKLRSEAANRRAQATRTRSGKSDVNASGSPGFSPPAPPESPPPTPPPNLSEIDIPPPPTELPPPPPPEVMEKIQQSINSGPPRG